MNLACGLRGGLRIAAAAIALALLTASPAWATHIERVVSPGGIEAWLVHEPRVPLIAIELAFAGGAAQDPADRLGTANLTAGLLDEGAGELDSKAFRERVERHAIELGFNASRDYLRGSLRTLTEHRDEAFDLLRLSLTSARFDTEPLERSRSQVLSSLRRETASPSELATRRFFSVAFAGHPYGRPSDGTLDSVQRITADDLRAYAKRVLAKDNLKIAVVGDIDSQTLATLLDKTFGELPAKAQLTPVPDVVAQTGGSQINIALDVPQTAVMFGAPALPRKDPDFMTGYVLNQIMSGSGVASRLYDEVREKRGLVYSISESVVWLNHAALLLGFTATRADRANETIDATARELKRMAEDGPTSAELEGAKAYLNGSQMLSLDTSGKIAAAVLQYQLDGLGIDYIDHRAGIINAVSLDDAKRVARKLWGQPFLTVAVGRVAQAARD
ncbi:MAG TPA: pitrilysin family protein [Vicinamibacterales bacterium]|nr:pitrilysin family protein [Vicinamibacterales bacterium]